MTIQKLEKITEEYEVLNKKTAETVKRIHLLTTKLCLRNCADCCNKLYDIESIPCVTKEELSQCEWLFLTGGEPFAFLNPSRIARYYKQQFKNIRKIVVYGNVKEFADYLFLANGTLNYVDGVSLSIKDKEDLDIWNRSVRDFMQYSGKFKNLIHNRLYCFIDGEIIEVDRFPAIQRKWVNYKEWKPADDSIFRRAF